MTDEAALLAAVEAAPADNAPRLAYADWLEENGDPERAAFVREQCLGVLKPVTCNTWYTKLSGWHTPAREYRDRPSALSPAQRRTVVRGLLGGDLKRLKAAPLAVTVDRGFVSEVRMTYFNEVLVPSSAAFVGRLAGPGARVTVYEAVPNSPYHSSLGGGDRRAFWHFFTTPAWHTNSTFVPAHRHWVPPDLIGPMRAVSDETADWEAPSRRRDGTFMFVTLPTPEAAQDLLSKALTAVCRAAAAKEVAPALA